jgi:hypothetical protein
VLLATPMVDVAQLVESRIVIPVVVGSSPIVHPNIFKHLALNRLGAFSFRGHRRDNRGETTSPAIGQSRKFKHHRYDRLLLGLHRRSSRLEIAVPCSLFKKNMSTQLMLFFCKPR